MTREHFPLRRTLAHSLYWGRSRVLRAISFSVGPSSNRVMAIVRKRIAKTVRHADMYFCALCRKALGVRFLGTCIRLLLEFNIKSFAPSERGRILIWNFRCPCDELSLPTFDWGHAVVNRANILGLSTAPPRSFYFMPDSTSNEC